MLNRGEAIEAVAGEKFEVVVIGGGITGAGVALDAASRGYSVALVEARDFAIGTSSRSSKMVHGGLRYLENFDLGLVREALLERQLMVELAPHLVYPTPFLVPTLGAARRDRKIGIGLNAYDVLAGVGGGRGSRSRREPRRQGRPAEAEGGWSPDRHRTIGPDEMVELAPVLADREPESAYLFYDCQTDDVRLVLTVLGEARALRGGLPERRPGHRGDGEERPDIGRRVHRGRVRRDGPHRGRQRGQRDRGLGRPDPPRRDPARRGRAEDRAEPRARTCCSRPTTSTWAGRPAWSRPARVAASSPCPGTAGRWSAPPTSTTTAASTRSPRPATTSPTCSTRSTSSPGPR